MSNIIKNKAPKEMYSAGLNMEQRPELAHGMRRSGMSYAEISERLQISPARVRQMVHRYDWSLRRPELTARRKH